MLYQKTTKFFGSKSRHIIGRCRIKVALLSINQMLSTVQQQYKNVTNELWTHHNNLLKSSNWGQIFIIKKKVHTSVASHDFFIIWQDLCFIAKLSIFADFLKFVLDFFLFLKRIGCDFFVVLLKRRQILTGLAKFAFFHTFANVPRIVIEFNNLLYWI